MLFCFKPDAELRSIIVFLAILLGVPDNRNALRGIYALVCVWETIPILSQSWLARTSRVVLLFVSVFGGFLTDIYMSCFLVGRITTFLLLLWMLMEVLGRFD